MEVVKIEMILPGKLPSMKILLRDNYLPVLENWISVATERGRGDCKSMTQFAETGHGNQRIIGSRSWESTPIFSFLVRTRHPDLIPVKHLKFRLFVFVNVT